MSGRSSAAVSTASTSSIRRPGRTTDVRTRTGPTGTGAKMSKASRTVCPPSIPLARSASRSSSAAGGPACCSPGSQGPMVSAVAS